jgi:hypothetical protein
VSLAKLASESELIVVARVIAVEDGPARESHDTRDFPPLKIAKAQIIETWKGKAQREVRYIASPCWVCDISDAVMDEKVLLFLTSRTDSPPLGIVHSGRGRMPTRERAGKCLAEIPSDGVTVPKNLPMIAEKRKSELELPSTEPGKPGRRVAITHTVRWIELGVLRRAVASS